MSSPRLALLVLLALAPACSKGASEGGAGKGQEPGAAGGGDPAADRAAIDKLRAAFMENYSAGDVKRLVATYTDDAVLMPGAQQAAVGKQAIQELLAAQFEMVSVQLALTSAEVVSMGDGWAFDRGTYRSTVRFRQSGAEKSDEGNYLVLWRRQPDGSWKIARDIDSPSSTPE